MLRTTTVGSACIIALALCIPSPAGAAKGGSPGGSAGNSVGSVASHSVGGSAGPGSFSRSTGPGPGSIGRSFAITGPGTNHIMTSMGHDRDHDRDIGRRFDRDHDRDFDRDHDHDRFRFHRFFPDVEFGINTYTYPDVDEDCFVLQRVKTRHGLRLRHIWVCG